MDFTRRSPLYMAAFAGVCIGAPMLLGNTIKNTTNPQQDAEREQLLRARGGMHHEVCRGGAGRGGRWDQKGACCGVSAKSWRWGPYSPPACQQAQPSKRGNSRCCARRRCRCRCAAQVLARAQKERLQVMLDELRSGGGERRYAAALK